MKTLNLYVTKSFLITLFVSIGVLTFGMLGVHLIRVFNYLSKGIPVMTAVKFMLHIMPFALSLTIPFGILVSVMLVFGRLSADKEITAMRACGISVLQIISPIIVITFLLTCLSVYLQLEVGPYLLGEAKALILKTGVDQPLSIIDPGRNVTFDNYVIYVDERTGQNEIRDIQLFHMNKDWDKVKNDITASRGKIEVDKEKQILKIILYDAIIVSSSGSSATQNDRRASGGVLEIPINYGVKFNRRRLERKLLHLTSREIFGLVILHKKLKYVLKKTQKEGFITPEDTTSFEVELNKRIVLALSPIAFMLLGMPLAIRTSRRETSVGLFLSVILGGIYFIGVIICPALDSHPEYYPQVLIWIPNIIYQGFGAVYLFKIARV